MPTSCLIRDRAKSSQSIAHTLTTIHLPPPLSSSQQSHVVHNRHPHPRLHSPSPTRPPLQSSHVYRIPTVQSLHLPRRLRQFEHIGSEVSGGIDRVFCVSESGESERCGEACAEEFERDLKRERESGGVCCGGEGLSVETEYVYRASLVRQFPSVAGHSFFFLHASSWLEY